MSSRKQMKIKEEAKIMSSRKQLKIKGRLNWIKMFTPVLKTAKDESKGLAYKVTLEVSLEDYQAATKVGLKRGFNQTEDGLVALELHCPATDRHGNDNKPFLVDLEGNRVTKMIAHGSEGIAVVELFPTKFGTGSELKGVYVTNLIEFIPEGNEEKEQVSIGDVPVDLPAPKVPNLPGSVSSEEDIDESEV